MLDLVGLAKDALSGESMWEGPGRTSLIRCLGNLILIDF